jgi:hypothetical protein
MRRAIGQALQIFDKADLQEIGLPMGERPSPLARPSGRLLHA